jgi:hypothetical protein
LNGIHTRLRQELQITANALKLSRRHVDSGGVVGVWDSQVFLINVHQFDIVFAQPICLCALEHEVNHIRSIFSLESQDVIVLCSAEDLSQGGEVDTEGKVSITAKGGEAFSLEHHRHEGDVGIVHSLEGDAGVIAVEIAVLHEIFDSIDHLSRY